MEEDRPLVESIADAIGALDDVYITVIIVFIGVALLIMGNTLARLIGGFLLLVLVVSTVRRLRAESEASPDGR